MTLNALTFKLRLLLFIHSYHSGNCEQNISTFATIDLTWIYENLLTTDISIFACWCGKDNGREVKTVLH